MLNEEQLLSQRQEIEKLLRSTERKGMEDLLAYLVESEFYTSPASTRYHGCYPGGLAKHSLGVYNALVYLTTKAYLRPAEDAEPEEITVFWDKVKIPALLHDLCKIGCYQKTKKPESKQPYSWVRGSPPGHGLLSLKRIMTYIMLTEEETMMIQYHMGIYFSREVEAKKGEYNIRPDGLFKAYNRYSMCKFIYFADEIASAQERAEEQLDYTPH